MPHLTGAPRLFRNAITASTRHTSSRYIMLPETFSCYLLVSQTADHDMSGGWTHRMQAAREVKRANIGPKLWFTGLAQPASALHTTTVNEMHLGSRLTLVGISLLCHAGHLQHAYTVSAGCVLSQHSD